MLCNMHQKVDEVFFGETAPWSFIKPLGSKKEEATDCEGIAKTTTQLLDRSNGEHCFRKEVQCTNIGGGKRGEEWKD